MLREVATSVVGSERLVASGFADWLQDSRKVSDEDHWRHAGTLAVGVQYSPRFMTDYYEVIRARCELGRETIIMTLSPTGHAAAYLQATKTGRAQVAHDVERIKTLAGEAEAGMNGRVRVVEHDRVLRYSFIKTEESIWIKFFTNSKDRAVVPAFKVRVDTPMYEFVNSDIERLIGDMAS